MDSVGEGEGGMIWEDGIETCILSYCRIQDAWGWCTGMTQRDGIRREVGGGFKMGTRVYRGGFKLMYGKTNTIL